MERTDYFDAIADELRRFNPNSDVLRLWDTKPLHRYTDSEVNDNDD